VVVGDGLLARGTTKTLEERKSPLKKQTHHIPGRTVITLSADLFGFTTTDNSDRLPGDQPHVHIDPKVLVDVPRRCLLRG
jgi:hypothetical protein